VDNFGILLSSHHWIIKIFIGNYVNMEMTVASLSPQQSNGYSKIMHSNKHIISEHLWSVHDCSHAKK